MMLPGTQESDDTQAPDTGVPDLVHLYQVPVYHKSKGGKECGECMCQ